MYTLSLLEMLNLDKEKRKTDRVKKNEKYYRDNALPEAQIRNKRSKDRPIPNDEMAILESLKYTCKFHEFLIDDLTSVFLDKPYPPLGYVATYHKSTPFDPRCFYSLFYNCSIMRVDYVPGFEDNWALSVNAIIPDESATSPSFFKGDKIDGPWYPCLGRGGWIAVCDAFDIIANEVYKALVIVSAPPPSIHEEMHTQLNRLFLSNTYADDALQNLEWFRQYAIENQKRLLYLLLQHGLEGITCDSIQPVVSPIFDE